jgi:hypothetical protein
MVEVFLSDMIAFVCTIWLWFGWLICVQVECVDGEQEEELLKALYILVLRLPFVAILDQPRFAIMEYDVI